MEELDAFTGDMARRPGFLIRRLHQVYQAFFAEEVVGMDVTPLQYSLMSAVEQRPGMDLAQICEEIAIDRATLGHLVERLEAAGLLNRTVSRLDKRHKLLSLTPKGQTLLEELHEPAFRANARTLKALSAPERAAFMAMLGRLVEVRAK
jgi:DNA-binding MarR family transcriptional regulator